MWDDKVSRKALWIWRSEFRPQVGERWRNAGGRVLPCGRAGFAGGLLKVRGAIVIVIGSGLLFGGRQEDSAGEGISSHEGYCEAKDRERYRKCGKRDSNKLSLSAMPLLP